MCMAMLVFAAWVSDRQTSVVVLVLQVLDGMRHTVCSQTRYSFDVHIMLLTNTRFFFKSKIAILLFNVVFPTQRQVVVEMRGSQVHDQHERGWPETLYGLLGPRIFYSVCSKPLSPLDHLIFPEHPQLYPMGIPRPLACCKGPQKPRSTQVISLVSCNCAIVARRVHVKHFATCLILQRTVRSV